MRGNECRHRHFYQDGDRKTTQPSFGHPPDLQFSSPISVKIRKEVSKQRKEEVDIETGKRRSWVETKQFDVLDLTGLPFFAVKLESFVCGELLTLLSLVFRR